MLNDTKRKFLFRCDSCDMIISTEFEEKEDLEKIQEDEMMLECLCGGILLVLRD